MAKTQVRYVCASCGKTSPAMLGRCPQCGGWNTMREEVVAAAPTPDKSSTRRGLTGISHPQKLRQVSGDAEDRLRMPMAEFSRVLGGGIVPGSIILIGGDPGIGKSTLLLQMALDLGAKMDVLYVSGEESERQIKMRAMRLCKDGSKSEIDLPENLYLFTETNLETILTQVDDLHPDLLVVDSIQTMYLPGIDSTAGSVTQVRECSNALRERAKATGMTVFLIGHVTKEGIIAGPRVLEHIVDTVLYLEGDRYQAFRLLRSVKNRFGATAEVGVFEMRETGLVEVANPSEAFLAERMVNAPGSAIAVTMEGTRPLLVEVQGLTSPSNLGNPRRTPNGVDFNRLLMVSAVLARRLGFRLAEQDIFVNIIGGLRISEPAADLAIAAAIASSMRDVSIRADVVLIGEVGLSGELRWVGQMPGRIKEASKLGFKAAIIPRRIRKAEPLPKGIEIIEARSLREALQFAFISREGTEGKEDHG